MNIFNYKNIFWMIFFFLSIGLLNHYSIEYLNMPPLNYGEIIILLILIIFVLKKNKNKTEEN